uniref:FBA_2 domain-containing protein n=1 Tax=Globodera pallida TaxID=36090 RepID=A0A183CM40_GLOPA
MSDNASQEQQQQQMEKIFICAEVCLETFAFINPFGLGLKMALINRRFDKLVDMHFVLREWSLCSMEICRANDENGARIINNRSVELPQPIPLEKFPDKVIGFKRIEISYFDPSVMEFLRRIRRLFDSSGTNVWFDTSYCQNRSWEIIRQIWPLVNDNICGLSLLETVQLDNLRRISPAILRNCANLRSINAIGFFPEFPAEDNAGACCRQALAKWLFTPRADGLPKMLYCSFVRARMDGLKRSFANALEPANFILRFEIDKDDRRFVPFELKNNWTGERLTTLRLLDKGLLVRCPIRREEDKWAKWEEEAIQWKWQRHQKNIAISFEDSDIGDVVLENQIG